MYKFGINRSIGTAESAFARAIGQTMQSLKSGRANREYHTVEDNYDVRLPGPAGNMTDDNWRIEQLEKSLMEKDILLSELQHRVKNDLNIILSLINLQMDKIHDNGSRQILVDLKARISTITSVYRQLSFSDIAGYVDLRSHVRNIAECLFNIYSSNNWNLVIKTDLTEIKVDVKNAALLGLMVNELVTNAIKHALPRTPKGEIRINIEKSGDAITLRVSDNGPGMPDGFEPELSDSLGLKLVSMVAAQIGGTVTTDGPAGRGTSVTVVFPYRREI